MKTKKFLSFLMALIVAITIIPMSAITVGATETSGTCGDNLTWEFDESTDTLTISGTGEICGYPYNTTDRTYNRPWENFENDITSVVIESGITSIGYNAFCDFTNLTNVTIGNSVTSIGDYAFGFCISLTSIAIPNSVTSIISNAFYDCRSLTSITIPDSVTSIGEYAFYNTAYYNDTNNWENDVLYIGNYLIKADESISGEYEIKDGTLVIARYALAGCDKLTSIIIPNSVTSIDNNAIYFCTSLASVTIGDSVASIGRQGFAYCESLTSVHIPDSVTSIGDNAFYRCYSLTSIMVDTDNEYYSSDEYGVLFNKDKTILIQYPIGNQRISYTIPDSVTSIDYQAFRECEILTSVTFPDSVTWISYGAFYYCTSLTDVYYCRTEEQWSAIEIGYSNESLLNAALHYHNYVDGTCTICGENKMILETMTSQIRFNTTAEKAYTGTFDVRTRVMISDEDFKELVGETNAEAVENIDKIGFVYTINGEDFSAESAKEVAQGGTVAGYVDAPVKNIQDAEGYYMFTCLVTDIPETDNNYVLTAYAYICVNGKWYVSEAPMDADFEVLYDTYYPVAAEKYGWEA